MTISSGTMEMIQLVANLCIVPLVSVIFSMHGRLAKIEGHLEALKREQQ